MKRGTLAFARLALFSSVLALLIGFGMWTQSLQTTRAQMTSKAGETSRDVPRIELTNKTVGANDDFGALLRSERSSSVVTKGDGLRVDAIGSQRNSPDTPAVQFCNAATITINDAANATPYPSTILVSGLTGVISNITVDLNGFGHTFTSDTTFLLVGPAGQKLRLLSSAGANDNVSGINFTFDDAAATNVPIGNGVASGTFKPSGYEYGDTTAHNPGAPAPDSTVASPYAMTLATFLGTAPNGTWSLYVIDAFTGDAGQVTNGWCLNITTAPAVTTCPAKVLQGSIAVADPTQTGRMTRDGNPSTCASAKVYPGDFTAAGARGFDRYLIANNSGSTKCITTTVTSACGAILFLAAYSPTFTGVLGTNYLADDGYSSVTTGPPMAFTMLNGQVGEIIVHAVNAGQVCASYSLQIEGSPCNPTASSAYLSGRIVTSDGSPVGGVLMRLSGGASHSAITDGNGNYRFDNLETGNFYNVSPSLANYQFSPASRSFSLMGNQADGGFAASADGNQSANAIDTAEYFVRQQYLDFLGREPDQGGFEYWNDQINQCNADAACIHQRRLDVSAAFFASVEFQQTGSYVYGVYLGGLGRPISYGEFTTDRSQVVGGANLDAAKTAFANAFVQRPEFVSRYQPYTTANSFVDALIQSAAGKGIDLSSEQGNLIAAYNLGTTMTESRGLTLRALVDSQAFTNSTYNSAFVLMEYFGYLRRDAEQGGYDFWLSALNNGDASNYRGMVCAFVTSTEYQRRFSSIVTHDNGECGQ